MKYMFTILKLSFIYCYVPTLQVFADDFIRTPAVKKSMFTTEAVPVEVATEIRKSLQFFMILKDYPQGFERIEDVKFTWLNIAGLHTRRAIIEKTESAPRIFIFPRLDIANEDFNWTTGIALIQGSNKAYRWDLNKNIELYKNGQNK